MREQDGGARRIDVATVVVEPEVHLHAAGADAEPVSPMVIEGIPIEYRPIIPDRAQGVRKDLQSKRQPVGGRQREVQPELGEFEATLRRASEVVIGRREQESLADEAVDLELGHLTRQGQPGRCSGTLCEKSEGRHGEDEAHLRRPAPFGAESCPETR